MPHDADRFAVLRACFEAALELPAAEREAFVRGRAPDEASAREVLELIAHAEHDDTFLCSPAAAPPSASIAGFRLGSVLGVGGMGRVHEAEQESPRRTVALKLLHPVAATPLAAKRLRDEATILARLQHPGIAQIFAAGTHVEAGVSMPWIAMELITGARTLTTFADAERLDQRARLELFVLVCDAVDHGHRHGVVHRDLKPGNILVDADGRPKVIDFGIAHVTEHDLDLATRRTAAGDLLGTIAYMSPEQCRCDAASVDARTDVYALGVVLYELLTGEKPYQTEGLPLPAAIGVVLEQAPRRARQLPADVEAIVWKAMEKAPARRYPSAAALAADLRRFLRHEPVTARSLTVTYHLGLWARRNRLLCASAVVVAAAMATATVVSARFAFVAEQRALEAETERAAADQTLDILESAVRRANPFVEQREVTVGELLDGVARRVEQESLRPDVQLRLREVLGASYRGLGRHDAAARHLEVAIAASEGNLLLRGRLRSMLGAVRLDAGDPAAALPLFDEAVRDLEAAGDPARVALIEALAGRGACETKSGAADGAMASLERAVALGERTPGAELAVAEACANLGTLHWQRGAAATAAGAWERAIRLLEHDLSTDHPLLAQARSNYGLYLQQQRRFAEAEAAFVGARDLFARLRGPQSADVANAELKLGFLFVDMQEADRAEVAFRRAVEVRRTCFGDDARQVPTALQGLGYLYLQAQRWTEARATLAEALRLRSAGLPAEHPDVAAARLLLGRAMIGAGDAAGAEPHLRAAMATRVRAFGAGDYRAATAASALGECLTCLGRLDDAEPLLRESGPAIEAHLGAEHVETRAAKERLERWRVARGAAAGR